MQKFFAKILAGMILSALFLVIGAGIGAIRAYAYKAGTDVTFTGTLIESANPAYTHQLAGKNVNLIVGDKYDELLDQQVNVSVHYYQDGRFRVKEISAAKAKAPTPPQTEANTPESGTNSSTGSLHGPTATTGPEGNAASDVPRPDAAGPLVGSPTKEGAISKEVTGRVVYLTGTLVRHPDPKYQYQLAGRDYHFILGPKYQDWDGCEVAITIEYQNDAHFVVRSVTKTG